MIQDAIIKIVQKEDLSYEESYAVMNEIMSGQTSPERRVSGGAVHQEHPGGDY